MEYSHVVSKVEFDAISEAFEWVGDAVIESIISQCLLKAVEDSVKTHHAVLQYPPPSSSWFRSLVTSTVTNERLAEVFYRLRVLPVNKNQCLHLKRQADYVEALVGEFTIKNSQSSLAIIDKIISNIIENQIRHLKWEAKQELRRNSNSYCLLQVSSDEDESNSSEVVSERIAVPEKNSKKPFSSTTTSTSTTDLQQYQTDKLVKELQKKLSEVNLDNTDFKRRLEATSTSILSQAVTIGLYTSIKTNVSLCTPATFTLLRAEALCKRQLASIASFLLLRPLDCSFRRVFEHEKDLISAFVTYVTLRDNRYYNHTFTTFYSQIWKPKVTPIITKNPNSLLNSMEKSRELAALVLKTPYVSPAPKKRKGQHSKEVALKQKKKRCLVSGKVLGILKRFQKSDFLKLLEKLIVHFACEELDAASRLYTNHREVELATCAQVIIITPNLLTISMRDGFYRLLAHSICKYHSLVSSTTTLHYVEIKRPSQTYDWKSESGTLLSQADDDDEFKTI